MKLQTSQGQYYRDRIVSLAPVAYWRLSEHTSQIALDEMGANNGLYQNSPALAQEGAIASAARETSVGFNGANQNIIVPHSPSLAIAGDISIEMLLLPRSYQSSYERLVVKQANISGDLYSAPYQLTYTGASGQMLLALGNGSSQSLASSTSGMPLNTWHHIVVTQKGTTTTYWLDGKQNGQATNPNARADAGGSVQLMGQGTRYPNARAAHISIHDKALGEDEVVKNYRVFAGLDKPRRFYVISNGSPALRWWHGA